MSKSDRELVTELEAVLTSLQYSPVDPWRAGGATAPYSPGCAAGPVGAWPIGAGAQECRGGIKSAWLDR